MPLPRPILRALRELWKTHKHPRWLFPNKGGTGPIGRGALNRAGIHASTVRSLRHGYATRLIECGVNIRVVQILLKTTTYYPRTPD